MPRGKRLKTKKKETKGLIEARLEAVRKWYEKHPLEHLKDLAKQVGSNTTAKDMINIGVALTFTPIVKGTIDTSEDLRARLKAMRFQIGPRFRVGPEFPKLDFLQYILGQKQEEIEQFEGLFPDWFDWLVAFGISYLLVTNFKTVLEVFGNVLNLAKAVLGVSVTG